jgi:antitoxin ParD1/3/4
MRGVYDSALEVHMTLKVKPEIERILKEKVEIGQYESLEEAANEMIQAAYEQETMTEEDIEELRREVAIGIEQADRGEFSKLTIDEIIAQEEAQARKQKAG